MANPVMLAPFSRVIVQAMRTLYPEELADKSWDNTGLLLEAPWNPSSHRQNNSALLTVDLTKAVADEAIERRDSIIIAYHPIIFRGLKSLTLQDTQQQSLLRLAAQGISVYCPHTAIDAAEGGLGDWLADVVTGEPDPAIRLGAGGVDKDQNQVLQGSIGTLQYFPSQPSAENTGIKLGSISHKREPIVPKSHPEHPNAGMGRIVRFDSPQRLTDIIDRVRIALGNPKGFPVAIPQGEKLESIYVSSIGLCAGSGGSLFKDIDVDLLFTGELSHHEALAATEKGQSVVCLFHSNTERGYLRSVLHKKLERQAAKGWTTMESEVREEFNSKQRHLDSNVLLALADHRVEIAISERDRDPYGVFVFK